MSEWRAVPPNFPEIDQFVLWLYPDGRMAVWEMDKDMDWNWVMQHGPEHTPTHWCQLPEPPSAPEARDHVQAGAEGNLTANPAAVSQPAESETSAAVSVLRVTAQRLLAERNALADALRPFANLRRFASGEVAFTALPVALKDMDAAVATLAQLTPQDGERP